MFDVFHLLGKRTRHHLPRRSPKVPRPPRLEVLEDRVAPAVVRTTREATAAGPEANAQAGIAATVNAFIADLGNPNNGNAVGPLATGRRQITWDGGDNAAAPSQLPANFFNATAPRGTIFNSDPRIQFQVSADAVNATATPIEFGNVNPTYPTAFSVFSSPRLFTALNNNVLEVEFFVPGTLSPALVSGFGAVFTDVDIANTSKIEFFGEDGQLLTERNVLATAGNESLSFLGITFDVPCVSRVRITSGTAAVGPNDVTQGGTADIVVLDDFLYGEPQPIPPAVTINQALGQPDPATGEPIRFTAVFSRPVTGFESSDVNLSASTTPGTLTATVTQSGPMDGTTYTIEVVGMTGTGNVVASIPAGAAVDSLDIPSTASTSTDNTVAFIFPETTVAVVASPQNTSTALPVTFTATVTASPGTPVAGTVDFLVGDTPLNATPIPVGPDGTASFTVPSLPAGTTTVTARFNPFEGSPLESSTGTVEVTGTPTDTIGVFDPTSGVWFLNNTNDNSPGGFEFSFLFGLPNWRPVTGDWDANGTTTAGIVDPTTSTFFLSDRNFGLPLVTAVLFGMPGWVPIAGDWDGGGGPTGIGIYDPMTSTFYLRTTPTAGPADFVIPFGVPGLGLIPVAGDWDGDGIDTVGLFDPNTATWFLRATNDPANGALVAQFIFGTAGVNAFGVPFSRPVVGDWDGDGTTTVGFFDTTQVFGQFFLRDSNTPGPATQNSGMAIPFGLPFWLPVSGNWGGAPLLQPLLAEGGQGSGALTLGEGELRTTAGAALARLEGAGVDPGVLLALSWADYEIADLPDGVLGLADVAGNRVLIDDDAAGWGWFVDPTPEGDEEFADRAGVGGRMDLLTAVLHEMGHLAGLGHVGVGLLGETLAPDTRSVTDVDEVFAQGL